MYLLDTNIFLEILLNQEKKAVCKRFLVEHYNAISISDFSFHSIGVILFRYKKYDVFLKFMKDVVSRVNVISLPPTALQTFLETVHEHHLDFDDFYQYASARYWGLTIVTMDTDFRSIEDVEVIFL